MRLTIIKSDGTVIIDGDAIMKLDLSFLPENVHAVQWYETFGEVEIKNQYGKIIENVTITSIEPYQRAIDLWQAAKTARELEEEEAAAKVAAAMAAQTGG